MMSGNAEWMRSQLVASFFSEFNRAGGTTLVLGLFSSDYNEGLLLAILRKTV
jgi:hypothetical protein